MKNMLFALIMSTACCSLWAMNMEDEQIESKEPADKSDNVLRLSYEMLYGPGTYDAQKSDEETITCLEVALAIESNHLKQKSERVLAIGNKTFEICRMLNKTSLLLVGTPLVE